MLYQIIHMLQKQNGGSDNVSKSHHAEAATVSYALDPKAVLPLDKDERGYNGF